MKIIELPKIPFSVITLQDKFINGKLKDNLDAYEYIFQYYFEVNCGMYYFYDVNKDEFVFKTDMDFKKEVLNKIPNKRFAETVKTNPYIYQVQCKIGKPRVYVENNNYFINESGCFKHQSYKPFDEYDNETKKKVKVMLDMIKEISCNNDDELFKSYMTYYAQLARGMKTEVIIYRKSPIQGFGKSKETDFIMKYVFGEKVCLLCSTSEPLISNFNKIFMGKLLIIFEELPTFSDSQWSGVSSKLKTLCTENMSIYRDVFEKPVQTQNISNFMINTNVESIKDSDGRRYIILDLNPSRKDDYKYFEYIIKECFNDKVGEAFFSYLLTKITDEECNKFYGQRDFPLTENKKIAISNRMPSYYKFIKENYILLKQDIKKSERKEFYKEYVAFCEISKYKNCGRNDFFKRLSEIDIKPEKMEVIIILQFHWKN